MAAAGATGITTSGILFKIRFRVLPSAPEGYQLAVQFHDLLLNEGRPSALGVNGYIYTLPVEPPEIPLLSEPEDGATDVPVNPVFYWHLTNWAQTYDFQVSTIDDFSSLVVDQTDIADTNLTVYGLAELTTFYWRVRAVNSLGESNWSAIWSFTTAEASINPPAIPLLMSPPNNAVDVELSMQMQWYSSEMAETYSLQMSVNSDFSALFVNITGISDTVYNSPLLNGGTVYFWRIRAVNAGGVSGWSESWHFTTVESNEIPAIFNVGIIQNPLFTEITDIYIIGEEPLLPASLTAEAILNSDTVGLDLTASGSTGRIFVDNDYNLTAAGILQLDISGQYISSTLPPNDTTIYITVTLPEPGKDLFIASVDDVFSISIPGEEITRKQYILLKKGMNFENEINSNRENTYSVISADKHLLKKATVSFNVENANIEDFSYQIAVLKNDEWVKLPTSVYPESGVVTAKTDYVGTFLLKQMDNSEEEINTTIKEFALYQNYPNPFNPQTNIKFKVKEKTFTILEIYDVLGQRVNTLVRKELAAGEYTIIWRGIDEKGKKVPSGIYMSLLKVNGRSFSKKMVLIR